MLLTSPQLKNKTTKASKAQEITFTCPESPGRNPDGAVKRRQIRTRHPSPCVSTSSTETKAAGTETQLTVKEKRNSIWNCLTSTSVNALRKAAKNCYLRSVLMVQSAQVFIRADIFPSNKTLSCNLIPLSY